MFSKNCNFETLQTHVTLISREMQSNAAMLHCWSEMVCRVNRRQHVANGKTFSKMDSMIFSRCQPRTCPLLTLVSNRNSTRKLPNRSHLNWHHPFLISVMTLILKLFIMIPIICRNYSEVMLYNRTRRLNSSIFFATVRTDNRRLENKFLSYLAA